MDQRRVVGVGLLLVSAAGFALGTILAAPIYDTGVDWLTLLVWRFGIGAALSWGWVLLAAERRAAVRRLTRRQVAVAVGLGTLYTGNAGTYYAGLETVPAALAGILVYTYPVTVAVLSLWFASRLAGRRPWFALVLAIAGIVLALGGIPAGDVPPLAGLALVMVSPVIYSVWIILSARLGGERRDRLAHAAGAEESVADDAAATTALMISATAVVFTVGTIVTGRSVHPAAIPGEAWWLLVPLAFVSSFLAIQTFYAGARRIGAAQAALVSTIEPVYIVVLAALFLDQRLAPLQLVGAALVLIGVVIAQTAPHDPGGAEPATPLDAEAAR